MLLHFFVGSGNLFHFEGPKKESKFWPAVVLWNECFNLRYYKQKIQVLQCNQVYFGFDWCNSHCQGLDVEWKVYILFQNYYQMEHN